MFQLLLIRHAQSANNALPESQRVPDPGLTPVGQLQAVALAEWLVQYRPTSLMCSGFRRALETTKPIAERLSLQPSIRYDLFEKGGCYSGYLPGKKAAAPGMGRSEIRRDFGEWEIDERISEQGWYHGRTLESEEQAIQRADEVARWIGKELVPADADHTEPLRPAFIIHADFKALLLESLLQPPNASLDPASRPNYDLAEVWNASTTQLTWVGHRWRLDFWNSIGHLPVEQLTH